MASSAGFSCLLLSNSPDSLQSLQHLTSGQPEVFAPAPVKPLRRSHTCSPRSLAHTDAAPAKVFTKMAPSPINNLGAALCGTMLERSVSVTVRNTSLVVARRDYNLSDTGLNTFDACRIAIVCMLANTARRARRRSLCGHAVVRTDHTRLGLGVEFCWWFVGRSLSTVFDFAVWFGDLALGRASVF